MKNSECSHFQELDKDSKRRREFLNKNEDELNDNYIYSVEFKKNLNKILFIKIKIYDHCVDAILDSGSDVNIIDANLVSDEIYGYINVKILGAGDDDLNVLGSIDVFFYYIRTCFLAITNFKG